MCGVFLTLIIQPSILKTNWWIVLLIVIPSIAFLILMVKKPEIMMIDKYWGVDFKQKKEERKLKKSQSNNLRLDYLLDKIKREGLGCLSQKERDALERLKDEL
ncbi:MAG: hypothetical protein ACI9LN_000513 [Saprospiraceae bacterium]